MSFRIENKYEISSDNLKNFYTFLKENNSKELFSKRVINSIYFDNENKNSFLDSEEGTIPRKKIRLRFYGKNSIDDVKEAQFEIKINSIEGRFKTSERITYFKKILQQNFYDDLYGICKPLVLISYTREYYSMEKFRITFDRDIYYAKYNGLSKTFCPNECIMEVKSPNLDEENYLEEKFPFRKIRYSKYCNSIHYLKLI